MTDTPAARATAAVRDALIKIPEKASANDAVIALRDAFDILPHFRVSLADAVAHDNSTHTHPSFLHVAASIRDGGTLQALLSAGARPRPGEDVYLAAVQAAVREHAVRHDPSTDLLVILSALRDARIHVPVSHAPSRATALCEQHHWGRCLDIMMHVDPHAFSLHATTPPHAGTAAALVDAASVSLAATQLRELMVHASLYDAEGRMAARTAAHALIRELQASDMLSSVVQHTAAQDHTGSLLRLAANTKDVDLVLSIARAGAVQRSSEDVYLSLLTTSTGMPSTIDEHGARVADERLAGYLRQLHAAGVKVAAREKASGATAMCAMAGLLACMRVMLDIDPRARHPWSLGRTVLHEAAAYAQTAMCELLLSASFSPQARDRYQLTPVATCLTAQSRSEAAMCATLQMLLSSFLDVRHAVRSCGLFHDGSTTAYGTVSLLTPYRRPSTTRMLISVAAAVGATAVSTGCFAAANRSSDAVAPWLRLVRCVALDERSVHGVYLPDLLRAPETAFPAIAQAVLVDALLDVQPCLELIHGHELVNTWGVWLHDVAPRVVAGVSATVSAWACMRRRQAIAYRRRVLSSLEGVA